MSKQKSIIDHIRSHLCMEVELSTCPISIHVRMQYIGMPSVHSLLALIILGVGQESAQPRRHLIHQPPTLSGSSRCLVRTDRTAYVVATVSLDAPPPDDDEIPAPLPHSSGPPSEPARLLLRSK